MIDKVVDSFRFKTLKEALDWARTSDSEEAGRQMANGILNTYYLKAIAATPVVHEKMPSKRIVMLIDCTSSDIRITFGTPSKTAPSFK